METDGYIAVGFEGRTCTEGELFEVVVAVHALLVLPAETSVRLCLVVAATYRERVVLLDTSFEDFVLPVDELTLVVAVDAGL